MTTNTTPTDPSLILAGIIRQVNAHCKSFADTLAEAILAHPGSRWGPAQSAPWPELPEEPPATTERGSVRQMGYREGWQAARAELQRLREQAGAAPTPAPALPEISDQLIRSLIGGVLVASGRATEESCLNRYWNPVPEVRARLCEILQLAAREHGG